MNKYTKAERAARRKIVEDRNMRIKAMLDLGMSLSAIASEVGMHPSSIRDIRDVFDEEGVESKGLRRRREVLFVPKKRKKCKGKGIDAVEAKARKMGISYGYMRAILDGYLPDRRDI